VPGLTLSGYILRFPVSCFGQISDGDSDSPIRWIWSISHHRSCADASVAKFCVFLHLCFELLERSGGVLLWEFSLNDRLGNRGSNVTDSGELLAPHHKRQCCSPYLHTVSCLINTAPKLTRSDTVRPFVSSFSLSGCSQRSLYASIIQTHMLQHIFPAASVTTNEGRWG